MNDDLGPLAVFDDLGGHAGACQRRGVRGDGSVVVDEEHRREGHRLTRRGREAVDLQRVADGDAVLMAAGADDRVHGGAPRHMLMGTTEGTGSAPGRVKRHSPNGPLCAIRTNGPDGSWRSAFRSVTLVA